jgi:hypothetical protein
VPGDRLGQGVRREGRERLAQMRSAGWFGHDESLRALLGPCMVAVWSPHGHLAATLRSC